MERETKVGLGIGAAVVALVAFVARPAKAKTQAPAVPKTTPDGQATVQGATFSWWWIDAKNDQGVTSATMFYADPISAALVIDAVAAASDATQFQTMRVFAQVNGAWQQVKK